MPNTILRIATLCIALFILGTSAFAEKYEVEKLFRKGAWVVELTHNSEEGSLWCTASTHNNFSQSLILTAYQTDELALFLFDPDWQLKPRPVAFLIDVDYSRWEVNGHADGPGVSVRMSEAGTAAKFLTELQEGSAVAVYNDNLQKVATFSLSGSHAAITSLFECWKSISLKTDPFGENSDPFGASSDPF